MLKRVFFAAAATLCGLTLVLLPLPAAQAAGQPGLTARADDNPEVMVWIDDSSGTRFDDGSGGAAQAFHDLFAGTLWSIDSRGLTIRSDSSVILTGSWRADSSMTFIPFHARSGPVVADGTVYRDGNDPSKGYAVFYLTVPSKDMSQWASARIVVDLAFSDGSSGSGGNGGGGNSGSGGSPKF